jgi:hypothetical protein
MLQTNSHSAAGAALHSPRCRLRQNAVTLGTLQLQIPSKYEFKAGGLFEGSGAFQGVGLILVVILVAIFMGLAGLVGGIDGIGGLGRRH